MYLLVDELINPIFVFLFPVPKFLDFRLGKVLIFFWERGELGLFVDEVGVSLELDRSLMLLVFMFFVLVVFFFMVVGMLFVVVSFWPLH